MHSSVEYSAGKEHLPFWAGKVAIQEYLEHINKTEKVKFRYMRARLYDSLNGL
jgi:hypothetical protein